MSGLQLWLMLVQDQQSSGECLFLWSFHRSLFYCSECSSNELVKLLREYWGICLFTLGFAVSLGRNFLFRAAWTLQTPWAQHKGFDGLAQLWACIQLGEISGASQMLSAVTSCLPPMGLSGQPRWQGAPEEGHRPIFPHWYLVETLTHWFCFIWPNVAILCQTRNHFEPYTLSKHTYTLQHLPAVQQGWFSTPNLLMYSEWSFIVKAS